MTLMGHSTGGAGGIAVGQPESRSIFSRLVLDSPWLEMHGSRLVRRAASGLVGPLARLRPETVLRFPERGFYWRTISSAAEGEWDLDDAYRPPMAFPVRAGWLSAILAGQARVAKGLHLDVPVLVLLSQGQCQRHGLVRGIHAAHGRRPGCPRHRRPRLWPGQHSDGGEDRWRAP